MRITIIIIFILVLINHNTHANQDDPDNISIINNQDLGPLSIRSQSPAQSLRLTPISRGTEIAHPGEKELRVMSNVSSIWARPNDNLYFLDYNARDIRLSIGFGFYKKWSIEFGINDLRIIHSGLDQMTLTFHDIFSFDQDGREEAPKNDTRISLPTYGIDLTRSDIKALTRSFDVTLSRSIIDKQPIFPDITVSGILRYELLDDGPIEEGSVDTGIIMSMAKQFDHKYLYFNLGYTHFGSSRFLVVPLEKDQFNGMLAYEWNVRPNQALLLQYLYTEGVVKNLGELSEASHEISLGYKWRLNDFLWELSLTENIINFDNSPDIGITFGMEYRF